MNNGTFCGFQFKKMLLSAIMIMVVMTLTDTMSIILSARFFGDNAMAGVNLLVPILFIVAFFSLMISTGTSYLYSFEIGAFRDEYANKLVGQGAILTLILSIVLGILVFFGEEVFFSFFPVSTEIKDFASGYYSCLFLIVAINPIYVLMQMMVYADGGGKNCVMAIILQLVVNSSASIVLGIEFGMAGIAFGTFLGYLAAVLMFAKWIFRDSQTLKPILYISFSETVKILKYSYVHASLYLHIGLGNMILNAFFLQTFGEEKFPILSVVVSVLQFSVFLDGIGQAAEPLINIYLGEKNFDGIKKVMNIAIKTALTFGAATVPVIFVFSANIAELFGIRAELLAESVLAIRIMAFSMPFIAILYLFATYYQIISRFKIALALSFCKDFAFYIVIPIIFSIFFGIQGLWLGMMSVSLMTCAIFIIFLRVRYKNSFPLLLPEADIISRDVKLNLERVLELRDWVEEEFRLRGFDSKILMRISLIIEEIGMSIVDNNPKNDVLAELTLIFDEKPRIIIRDNGLHFDLTDEAVNSFRSFFIYSFLEGNNINRRYLTTQNYNRHIFNLVNE